MSRMKHLLRKLHIGGGLNEHQRLATVAEPRPPVVSPVVNAAADPLAAGELSGDRSAGDGSNGGGSGGGGGECLDFNFLEEEFQVQLALAISASDPDARDDPETAQIDAAKRISLGCSSASVAGGQTLVDMPSLHYWNYNVVNYNEKIVDGFYDVYTVSSSPLSHGKMPLLVDLQQIAVSDGVNYEVILVNRMCDLELQRLERRAHASSTESRVSDHGLVFSGLIQKIADIVVERMGGPVSDADEMTRKWTTRRDELRSFLNTIIPPLGHLDFGLSRHRALLFKVLADTINLPCMLIKGSYYTGTDDGAVNLIKVEDGSEYIIDLMGAPGTLIPAEVPSSQILNSFLNIRSIADVTATPTSIEAQPLSGTGSTRSDEALSEHVETSDNPNDRCENECGKFLSSPQTSCSSSLAASAKASSAQKKKVKNVSKYVISAAKNPEFAQKLHAVLLESGASPPPDLFSDISSQDSLVPVSWGEGSNIRDIENVQFSQACNESDTTNQGNLLEPIQTDAISVAIPLCSRALRDEHAHALALPVETSHGQKYPRQAYVGENRRLLEDAMNSDVGKVSANIMVESASGGLCISSKAQSERMNRLLGYADKWEILWEDLRIGERIGIGSYGEVYHADWNGTEVAVKKFLNQDFSGEALGQFRSEVEIMLRLRHPNVVLFMGAVTRSPHFSILTEFLPRGSLYRLLHRPNSQLDEKRRMKMALDVAKGMNYLHTSHPTIVHRDLKSPNLLVDRNWVVKVCDFGLSRMKHHTFLSSKSTAGTPEWMAPEVLRNEPANEKCDVYSFGVILWELTTCRIPWKGLNPMQVVGAVGFQNRRLEIPDEVDPEVAQIIHDCWLREPNLRPSFSQLMIRLRCLQRFIIERPTSSPY